MLIRDELGAAVRAWDAAHWAVMAFYGENDLNRPAALVEWYRLRAYEAAARLHVDKVAAGLATDPLRYPAIAE